MHTSRLIRIVLALLAVVLWSALLRPPRPTTQARPAEGGKADGLATSSLAKAAAGEPQGPRSDVKVEGGRAQVELSGTDPTALAAAVEAKGGTVDVATPGKVRATDPTSSLTALANDPAVGWVAPVRRYAPAFTSPGTTRPETSRPSSNVAGSPRAPSTRPLPPSTASTATSALGHPR